MSWLGTRILGWRPFGRGAEGATAVLEAREGQEGHRTDGAPLMILVPDAGGRSSFRPYAFEDAESAAAFIELWYPAEAQPPVAAFWALEGQPEAAAYAEVVVLIRDPGRPGTVHVFSFLEMELAQSFVRVAAAEGTDLELVQMYWAAPLRIEMNRWGNLEIKPSVAPPVSHKGTNGAAAARPTVGAAMRPGADTEDRAATAGTRWPSTETEEAAQGPELEARPATPVEEPPRHEESHWQPSTAEREERIEIPWRQMTTKAESEAEPEESARAPEAVAEAALMVEASVWQPPAHGPEPQVEDNGQAHGALTWPELVVEEEPATPEAAAEVTPVEQGTAWEPPAPSQEAEPEGEGSAEGAAGEVVVEEEEPAPPQAVHHDAEREARPQTDAAGELDGLLNELSKTLNVKRWEVKEQPFRGFGSPPGKF